MVKSDIFETIYAAAIDPARWIDVVTALTLEFPGSKIVIHAEDARARRNIGVLYRGFSATVLNHYSAHLAEVNPWVPLWAPIPALQPLVSDDVLPSSAFQNSEFYDEFIRAEGEIESATGIKLFQENDRFAALSIHYGSSVAETYNRQIPRALKRLGPHLRNAIEINRRLSDPLIAVPTLKALIELSPHPTWLLDADGRVRIANAAAIRVLDERREAWLDSRERLVPRDCIIARRLNAMRLSYTDGRSGEAFDQVPNGRSGQWSITPLIMGPQSVTSALFARSSAALLVTLEHATRPTIPNVDDLRSMFHLTPAEARLALQLSSGEPLSQAADQLGVSKETARAQLKSVFAKTDTHRQSELVALLAGSRVPGAADGRA